MKRQRSECLNFAMPSKFGKPHNFSFFDSFLLKLYFRHLHESQNISNAGGKTPFGAGARTPARLGGATPGRMSVRAPARTPNPYGGATPSQYPAAPPSGYSLPPKTPYGYQTPSHRPPNFPPQPSGPPGMNADRAAMIQQNAGGSGWRNSGGWP